MASPFNLPNANQMESRQAVVDRFREISGMYGEVTFTPSAKKKFEDWYQDEFNELHKRATNMEFQSRKHIHVVKCAMLLAISELKLVIDDFELEAAIELLSRVESNMKFIYMSAGANRFADLYLRILSAIKSVGSIEYHQLLRFFMKDVDEEDFIKILNTMQTAKYIKQLTKIDSDNKQTRIVEITPAGRQMFERYNGGN